MSPTYLKSLIPTGSSVKVKIDKKWVDGIKLPEGNFGLLNSFCQDDLTFVKVNKKNIWVSKNNVLLYKKAELKLDDKKLEEDFEYIIDSIKNLANYKESKLKIDHKNKKIKYGKNVIFPEIRDYRRFGRPKHPYDTLIEYVCWCLIDEKTDFALYSTASIVMKNFCQ